MASDGNSQQMTTVLTTPIYVNIASEAGLTSLPNVGEHRANYL